jgi:hypothetical protein
MGTGAIAARLTLILIQKICFSCLYNSVNCVMLKNRLFLLQLVIFAVLTTKKKCAIL